MCPAPTTRLIEHGRCASSARDRINSANPSVLTTQYSLSAFRPGLLPTATMDDPVRDEEAGLNVNRAQIRQRSSLSSFLFITFLLFMLTSHNGDEFLARHQYQDALRSLNYQLSNYTAWMNGTSSEFSVVSGLILYIC